MLFSRAIQIKQLVNRWNQDRWQFGYGYVEFKCSMFLDGHWSVLLKPVNSTLFFSLELQELLKLYADGGFSMVIGAIDSAPYIDLK